MNEDLTSSDAKYFEHFLQFILVITNVKFTTINVSGFFFLHLWKIFGLIFINKFLDFKIDERTRNFIYILI